MTPGAKQLARSAAVTKPVLLKPRACQLEFERGMEIHRICAMVARRQLGKTTGVARIALKKMIRKPGHDVIFGSVKLDLGREIVRKEASQLRTAIALLESQAAAAQTLLKVVDGQSGKELPTAGTLLSADDFDEMYEACRLEMRLYHSNSIFSRTKVVALTPDAVGETGDLVLDEVGRAKKFREVCEAMWPIASSNPEFRVLFTTTPPPDDQHYSFELLAPPIEMEFKPNPRGNWYRTDHGVHVLRVDAWDAYADGVPLYDDDTGKAISPDESRARAIDKEAWDRNYGVKFIFGGTAACGFVELDTAQRRGVGQCRLFVIDDDKGFREALQFLAAKLGKGPVGGGIDLATTEKETSNPTSFTVTEQEGHGFIERCVFVWKTKDPRIAKERFRAIVQVVNARKEGGRMRRLCIDATNERYFASEVRDELAALVPVELVIGSETIELPGKEEPITMKQMLGAMYVAELNDNHLTAPPERYFKEDHRLVRTEKGQFVCEPDVMGRHGDTFDSGKNSIWALRSNAGAIRSTDGMYVPGVSDDSDGFTQTDSGIFVPDHLALT